MQERDVFTFDDQMPPGLCLIDARANVRADPPATDEDVVVRFYNQTRKGAKFYHVVRLLKDEVATLRMES